jgi:dienelactone hydrolase
MWSRWPRFSRFWPGLVLFLALAAAGADDVVARFHQLLDRPAGPPGFQASCERAGSLAVEKGIFASDAATRVPYLLLKPAAASGRLPAVIVLHGTGGSKEGMRATLEDLARRGLLAIAIDARYHGDRIPGGAHGRQEYEDAILRVWREPGPAQQEHPLYWDTVYDVWRTVDRLGERADVDPARIGVLGFSMGGIEAWYAAATDPRLKVVVPAIAVQSFRWSLEHDQWQGRAKTFQRVHEAAARDLGEAEVNQRVCRALWTRLLPGALDEFDGPAVLPRIAPRPLLILSGENDPNCPLAGAQLAFAAAEAAYRRAGAAERLVIDVAPGAGHVVTPAQRARAAAFLERWLNERGAG